MSPLREVFTVSSTVPGNAHKHCVCVFPSRMKRTAFLLVFGVLLSFGQAQVSPVLKSAKSSSQLLCTSRPKIWWSLHILFTLVKLSANSCDCYLHRHSRRRERKRWWQRRNMSSSSPPLRLRWAPPPRTSATTCFALLPAVKLPPTSSWPPSACLLC